MGEKNDIILIAGKWDERTIVRNDWKYDWHDKSVVTDILKKIAESNLAK
jgi:hypothetical protein